MKIDMAYTGSPLGVEAAAVVAWESGYRGLWTSEAKHDPFLTLLLANRSCPELTIASGIAVALARSPFTLAQTSWDLAQLSQGRFMLGLGSQVKAHVTRRFSMPWEKPVGQMREMIGALRAIWHSFSTGEKLRFEGEYYRHTLLTPNFNPGPAPAIEIPIGLAAVGPQMTALAGEVADFVILHPFTHPGFVESHSLTALEQGWTRAGRRRSDLEVVVSVFAFTEGPGAAEAETAVRQKIAFYGSTPAYRQVLVTLGREALGQQLHRLSQCGDWQTMTELIDDDLLESFCVRAPDLSSLFERVRARFGALCDRAVLTVPGS